MGPLFVFSNDDAGNGDTERFYELLGFLKNHNVAGTFFAIPMPGGNPLSEEWVRALDSAKEAGHDIQMHGLAHGGHVGCEFGVTPGFVLDIIPGGDTEFQHHVDEIEEEMTIRRLMEKLRKGIDAFEKALNVKPEGFRSPCAAVHRNMFKALKMNGFLFDSSVVVNTGGWRYISKYRGIKYLDQEYSDLLGWEEGIPIRPYIHESGIVEVPIISEYTWYIGKREIERQLALALDDMGRIYEAGGVFVALSHFQAMTGEHSAGLKLYDRLFDHARKQGAEFVTMKEAIKQVVS